MSVRTRAMILVAAMLSIPAGLTAADDPFVGSWKLNIEKSKYNPGPPPPKGSVRILTIESVGGGRLKVTIPGVDAQGRPDPHSRVETYDGKPQPTGESPDVAEAFSAKRVDLYTIELDNYRKGQVISHLTRTVSKDGKTMILKSKGTTVRGQPFEDMRFYEKQ